MLKHVILAAAGMVIAAVTFRGGRLVRGELPPASPIRAAAALDGEQKPRLVLDGAGDPRRFAELSERHGIPEAQLHEWRQIARTAAARALADHDNA